MTMARVFRGFRFPAEVILWAVRWHLQFPISYRDLERMPVDRGVAVDHVTLHRWTQRFAPELEQRTRRHLRPCRGPWHVDETYAGSVARGAISTGRFVRHRRGRRLNNRVEQDHRRIKRRTGPMLGFQSFWTARRAPGPWPTSSWPRPRPGRAVPGDDLPAQRAFVHQAFGLAV